MDIIISNLEHMLNITVSLLTIFLELLGIIVLVFTSIKSFISWIKKEPNTQLNLAHGISLALSFKMGGEVLRTVVVREWGELLILGAIILLRAMLTFLIMWEIKNEEGKKEK